MDDNINLIPESKLVRQYKSDPRIQTSTINLIPESKLVRQYKSDPENSII